MAEPFEVAWVRRGRFGVLAAVPLPIGLEPVGDSVLARLHAEERALVAGERGRRVIEFAGGRLATRAAMEAVGVAPVPVLSGAEREPLVAPHLSLSITHKTDLAVALVSEADGWHRGVDLEGDGRARLAIASRVCRPEELAEVESLPEAARWPAVMARFALKEAVYKAVFPLVRHFFGFQAARVDLGEPPRVTLFLPREDPAVEVEAMLEPLGPGRVLALVRARATG